jgi:hypothetical protein
MKMNNIKNNDNLIKISEELMKMNERFDSNNKILRHLIDAISSMNKVLIMMREESK